MKKPLAAFFAALFCALFAAPAFAEPPQIPPYFPLSKFPGLSSSVQGTGIPGLDGGSWNITRNNTTFWDGTPSLTVKRLSKYGSAATTGVPGTSYPWATIFAYTETNPGNIGYEWSLVGWNNHSANASTGAEAVGANGTVVKQAWGVAYTTTGASGTGSSATVTFSGGATIPVGHTVWLQTVAPSGYQGKYRVTASAPGSVTFANATTGAQTVAGTVMDISISYGAGVNGVCANQTGESDPIAPCIGAEFDQYNVAGTTDANRQNIGVQIQNSAGHTGRGIFMATKGGGTIDRVMDFSGAFNFGMDFTSGTFAGPVMLAAPGQKIALDSDTSGNYTRSLFYDSAAGAFKYMIGAAVAFSVDNSGVASANKYVSNAGNDLLLTAASGKVTKIGVNGVDNVYTLDTGGFYPTNASTRTNGTAALPWKTAYNNATVSGGTAPTNSGTCAINTQVGGNTAGSFKANGACSSGTIVLTFATTAPNGWACTASDLTTPANLIKPGPTYTTTTATFTGVTMAASDLVTFSCVGF